MATLPAANYLTDNARTEGEFKAGLEAMLAATKQIPGAGTADLAYTIAAGSITPAGGGGVLVVETESLAASDDLANVILTNYPDGSMLLLRNNNAARVVVVKHAATGSGQILLDRNADYVLDDTKKYLLIQRRGTDWYEVLRGPMRASMAIAAAAGAADSAASRIIGTKRVKTVHTYVNNRWQKIEMQKAVEHRERKLFGAACAAEKGIFPFQTGPPHWHRRSSR